MKKAPFIIPLCAGIALGAGAVWTARHFRPADAPASATAQASSSRAAPNASVAPAPSVALILPPPLAGAEADAALEAYLALPVLAKDAPSSEVQERMTRLRALLTLLPAAQIEKLLANLATRIGDAEAKLRRAAFDVWVETDAPAAARWALTIAPGEAINAPARARYVALAALAWARDDFPAVWAWAGAISDADLRKSILPQLLAQLAAKDPQQALALGASLDANGARSARRLIFQAWAERDPVAAIRGLGPALLENRGDEWPVQQALVKWVARDPGAALDWAVAQPITDGDAYRSVLNNLGWYLTDSPASVRPFAEKLAARTDIPGGDQALKSLLGAWQRKDPAAAVAWLGTLTDIGRRSDLVSEALGYVEQSKTDDFMALVRLLPESPERAERITQRIGEWAKKDPDAALAWLTQHPEPELADAYRKVEGVLIANLAATDPQAAIARFQSIPARASSDGIAVELAASWAKSDPAAATRWLAGIPTRSGSFELTRIGTVWVRTDPVAYADWVASLPEGNQRNYARYALTSTQQIYGGFRGDQPDPPPRAAFAEKLAQIKDPDLRASAVTDHITSWMRSDVNSARAWLENTDALTPEQTARLLLQAEAAQ